MICKNCKRDIEENSLFCNWCGERQVKESTKETKVPKPRFSGGKYWAQIMVNGKRQYVSGNSEKEYYAQARALKEGLIEIQDKPSRITLNEAITEYINSKRNVLSPGTIRTYLNYQRNRFKKLQTMRVCDITQKTAQKAVNDESKDVSAKTVKDAWHFVATVLGTYNVHIDVKLKAVASNSKKILSPEETKRFCKCLKGNRLEVAALMALHSMRMSELNAVKWKCVNLEQRYIEISGSRVLGENNELVFKETNKSDRSRRVVPIMSDQLLEALKNARPQDYDAEAFVVPQPPYIVSRWLKEFCEENGFPNLSMHSLRHTFASLGAYLKLNPDTIQQIGGWKDSQTVKKVYTHTYLTDVKNSSNAFSAFLNQ